MPDVDLPAFTAEVPLAERTTIGLGGPAEWFFEARSENEVLGALARAKCQGLRVTVLAGGSNVLVPDAGVPGLVLVPALRGIVVGEGDEPLVTAAAGEPWDAFVAHTVARDLAGLECLSGIPGSVGATPVQNVGAYGVEVEQRLHAVRVLDRTLGETCELRPDECGFGYRDSRLKREPDRFLVLAVTFRLRRGAPDAPRYAELAKALPPGAPLATVRETVLALRRSKSMVLEADDVNRRSVGSFFTNPIVSREHAADVARRALALGLVSRAEDVPTYAAPNGVKLAAGWLIERSGTHKGERHGHVGVSTRHALSLVHHGGGTTAELLAFAAEVAARVERTFGVELVREPVLLPERA